MDRYKQFLEDVATEIESARQSFPDNDKLHCAFTEEAGEVSMAILDCHRGTGDYDEACDVYLECVQAAAMACRLACEGDPDFKYDPDLCFMTGQEVLCAPSSSKG